MKNNTKPLPGMMELLPEEQLEFNRIMSIIQKNYEKFGFRSYGISESLHGGAVWYDMRIDF